MIIGGHGGKLIARIFFGTDESILTPDDRRVLYGLGKPLKKLVNDSGGILEVGIKSMADIRGTVDYNKNLSKKRGIEVKKFLENYLGALPGSKINTEDLGEEGAHNLPELWAYERRVDVSASWHPYNGAENVEPAKDRTNIFRNYYSEIDKWKGLVYLIEHWNLIENDRYVKINPNDFDAVRKLVKEYSPEIADNMLVTERDLSEAITVIIKREYSRAYEKYEEVYCNYRKTHRGESIEESRKIIISGKQR